MTHRFWLLLTSAVALSLSGCASDQPFNGQKYSVPKSISFAWDDGVNTFVIPNKGVALSTHVFTDLTESKLQERGSYFFIGGVFKRIVLSDQAGNPIVIQKK